MDPVFTLQWPEFLIAEKLQKLFALKKKKGEDYSILVPLSRQEKGIDLAILKTAQSNNPSVVTLQVKASRTYLLPPPKRKGVERYKYYTWFNCFKVPERADFIILIGLFAPALEQTLPVSEKWYKDCSLLFTREEMNKFFKDCKTVKGEPEKMFGFGFNDLSSIILTRGDKDRTKKEYKDFLLENRFMKIKEKLSS